MRRRTLALLATLALAGCRSDTTYVYVDAPAPDLPEPEPEVAAPIPEPTCSASAWSLAVVSDGSDLFGSFGVSPSCEVALGADFEIPFENNGLDIGAGATTVVFDAEGQAQWQHANQIGASWLRSPFDNAGRVWMAYGGPHQVQGAEVLGTALWQLESGKQAPVLLRSFRTMGPWLLGAAGERGLVAAGSFIKPFVLGDEVLFNETVQSWFLAVLDGEGARLASAVIDGVAEVKAIEGDWYGNAHAWVVTGDPSIIGPATIGQQELPGPGDTLVRLADDGSLRVLPISLGLWLTDMAVDLEGNMLLLGDLEGEALIGDVAVSGQGPTLVALDAAGALRWTRAVDATGMVALDGRGHAYVVQKTSAVTVVELDPEGEIVASQTYANGRYPKHIAAAPAGGLVLGGATSGGIIDFGSGANDLGDGSKDVWLASLPPAP
jgi:hypothetical protein